MQTISGSSSEPRARLETTSSRGKQRGQSLKDIFVSFFRSFFCWGLGITILVCFLKMSENCYVYENPGICLGSVSECREANTREFFIDVAQDVPL